MGNLKNLGLGEPCVLGGDWNINAATDKGTNPNLPAAVFKSLGLRRVSTKAGTHGDRPIDYFGTTGVSFAFTGGPISGYGSDHKPVVATIITEV